MRTDKAGQASTTRSNNLSVRRHCGRHAPGDRLGTTTHGGERPTLAARGTSHGHGPAPGRPPARRRDGLKTGGSGGSFLSGDVVGAGQSRVYQPCGTGSTWTICHDYQSRHTVEVVFEVNAAPPPPERCQRRVLDYRSIRGPAARPGPRCRPHRRVWLPGVPWRRLLLRTGDLPGKPSRAVPDCPYL